MNPLRSVRSSLLLGVVLALLLTLAVKYFAQQRGIEPASGPSPELNSGTAQPADNSPPPVEEVQPQASDRNAPDAAPDNGGSDTTAPDAATDASPAAGDDGADSDDSDTDDLDDPDGQGSDTDSDDAPATDDSQHP